MDIHKPKPVHSWRELLSEIGVIVIGVLIALGAEQVVEALHWRHEVAEARETIRSDISSQLATARERRDTAACVDQRLDQLAAILAEASRSRRLPPLGAISGPGAPGFSSGVWRSYETGQVATHFAREEHLGLTSFFDWADQAKAWVDADVADWQTLGLMVGPGRPLDPFTEGALYAALTGARTSNRRLRGTYDWFTDVLRTSGLPAGYASADRTGTNLFPTREICQPISRDVPVTYGQSANGTGGKYRVVTGTDAR